jgi:DNA-directed RNA polymerase subunit beta'
LTRRLVDAAQNIIVREDDCGTLNFEVIYRDETSKSKFGQSFEERIYGKHLAEDVIHKKKVVFTKGDVIDKEAIARINELGLDHVAVRGILTCETEEGVCKRCYGLDLAHRREAELGTPIGIIAAQSIGEPGTQLTMRTFHTG